MPQNEDSFEVKHLAQLIGKTVKCVAVSPRQAGDLHETHGLMFTDGTIAWVLCDPEGNGPGHLDIVLPSPRKKLFGSTPVDGPPCLKCGADRTKQAKRGWRCPKCGHVEPRDTLGL